MLEYIKKISENVKQLEQKRQKHQIFRHFQSQFEAFFLHNLNLSLDESSPQPELTSFPIFKGLTF